jgi:hypothetical protein
MAFHDKDRINNSIGRLAIEVAWRQPTIATAVAEARAEFLATCRTT